MKKTESHFIVIIEDSDADFVALSRSFKQQGIEVQFQRFLTGDEALDFLPHHHPLPHLILLDLNLPGTDGREILKSLKQHETLKKIPVIILTTSNNPADIQYCYQLGANSYIQKPIDYQMLLKVADAIKKYWLEVVALPSP